MKGSTKVQYRCSFCGKAQEQVSRLIAGPGGVYICNECISLCQEIVDEEQTVHAQRDARPDAEAEKGRSWRSGESATDEHPPRHDALQIWRHDLAGSLVRV